MSFRWAGVLAAVGLFGFAAACGDSTTCPTTQCTPVNPPTITCPADITVTGAPAIGQVVTFTPTVAGGTPPVTTTCAPASGSVFPVGSTTVTCTVKDAISRSSVCPFNVTLKSQHLGAMRIVAFGDSITAGENGDEPFPPGNDNPVNCEPASAAAAARAQAASQIALPQFIDVANAYPTKLLALLNARFVGQSIVMVNEGLRGETAYDGMFRMNPCVFTTDQPDTLLLLEGINDLGALNYQPTSADATRIAGYLQNDVTNALSHGVSFVFVSTVLPVQTCPNPENCRMTDGTAGNNAVNLLNSRIRTSIGGATIVDGNAAFLNSGASISTLIGDDGLHPTPAGYTVLANALMNAIVNKIPITSLRRVR
jgi:lysophospholipase L1-like esterase